MNQSTSMPYQSGQCFFCYTEEAMNTKCLQFLTCNGGTDLWNFAPVEQVCSSLADHNCHLTGMG